MSGVYRGPSGCECRLCSGGQMDLGTCLLTWKMHTWSLPAETQPAHSLKPSKIHTTLPYSSTYFLLQYWVFSWLHPASIWKTQTGSPISCVLVKAGKFSVLSGSSLRTELDLIWILYSATEIKTELLHFMGFLCIHHSDRKLLRVSRIPCVPAH